MSIGSWRTYASIRRALRNLGWAPARLIVATGFVDRLFGMAGRSAVAQEGEAVAMAFPRCRAVHTCFMRAPIDIAFIGAEGEVLALHRAVPPWRFRSRRGAAMVIERSALQDRRVRLPPHVDLPR